VSLHLIITIAQNGVSFIMRVKIEKRWLKKIFALGFLSPIQLLNDRHE